MGADRQRAQRDGIVYKQISFDFPIEDNDAIVKAYEQAITPRTKLVHVTHMVNWVGQTMPVRQIADMAHARGIEVIADGAHSFGLMDFKIPDLDCDYFGTSLHKFLSAPIGSRRKQERIFYLKNYWATRVCELPGVKLHTSLDPKFSCAICGVSIEGMN